MISPSRHRKSSHRSDWRHVRSTNTDLIYYTFIPELHQHLQHMDSDLFRIIIQTGTDKAEAARCQNPATQHVRLVLLILLIVLIRSLLHGDLPSSSQTGTCHPETAHLSALTHPDHSDQDGGCYRTPRYEIRSD